MYAFTLLFYPSVLPLLSILDHWPPHRRSCHRLGRWTQQRTSWIQSAYAPITVYILFNYLEQYWKNPGALSGAGLEPKHKSLDQFLGILTVIVQAAFSFQGMELVVMFVSSH